MMNISLELIKKGMPGLSPTVGAHLYEGCIVCLTRNNHDNISTEFVVDSEEAKTFILSWDNEYNDQIDRSWKDQATATEYGAYCLAILIAVKITGFTVIEQSARDNGFDYYLGKEFNDDSMIYKDTAKLEVSGIFNNRGAIIGRYNLKIERLEKYKSSVPVYIGIIEFGTPQAKFGNK